MQRLASFALICMACVVSPAIAQDKGWIEVRTNEPTGHVYIDAQYAGIAATRIFSVDPGERLIEVRAPERTSWSMEPVAAHLNVLADDTIAVHLALPHYYRIESVPYGARVQILDDGALVEVGTTPLTYTTDTPLSTPIHLDKSGYLSATVDPGEERWNRHSILLERALRGREAESGAEVDWRPPRAMKSRWIDYTAVGLAIVSGVVAVHYKFKADDLYAHYEDTGDPSVRDQISRLDTRSAVALGTMQVGIGVFAIRLALR